MDSDRKAKSFSLESPEPEELAAASNTASSVTDLRIRSLGDNDFRDLLDEALKPKYQRNAVSTTDADADDDDQSVSEPPAVENCVLGSRTGPSKDVSDIHDVLKEEADRDVSREDEAHDTHFEQKKLGKSASHESCQSRSMYPPFGRHSAFSSGTAAGFCSVEVDSALNFSLKSEGTGAIDAVSRNNARLLSSRMTIAPSSNSDVRSGRRSPGAAVALRSLSGVKDQRSLNRSNSSSATGHWPGSDWNTNDDPARLVAKMLNSERDGRSGFRDFAKSNSTDGTKEFTSDTEPVELQAIRRQNYGGAFQSSESVAAHQSGKKPRSTSQHDYNNRSYPAPLSDDCGRMTKSEMGFMSGIKSPPRTSKGFRRKKTQQEERLFSEQVNGFRGDDEIDDLLVYIEGTDAVKKSQSDPQTKKAKKKSSTEVGANGSGNQASNWNTKKEKVRRSTEGDDGTFAALKSGNANAGGTLSYKHRSTDSLGLSYNEDDRRPFVAVGKSTSSDDGIGGGRLYRDDQAAYDPINDTGGGDTPTDSSGEGDALMPKRPHMEGLKEVMERGSTGEEISSGLGASVTTPTGDDEQFIPVTNKKQKKNKADQFRNATTAASTRYGRSGRSRAAGYVEHAKRSVTPPARETATSSGRRRRNSLDYSRVVNDRVTSADLKRSPTDTGVSGTIITPAKETGFAKPDGGDAAATATTGALDESTDSSKPSYANVAAANRHFHSPPNLGDFVARAMTTSSKQKFDKKRSSNFPGSRDGRTSRDDGGGSTSASGSRQTPRQASSLNASRSSSPVNIPTAVATNLANASSPDLKNITGDSSTQPMRRTYATIAAERRHLVSIPTSKPATSAADPAPVVDSSHPEKEAENLAGGEARKLDAGQNEPAIMEVEETKKDVHLDPTNPGDVSDESLAMIASTSDANERKQVTETAVNMEAATSTPNIGTPTGNLGDSAFIFEQAPSTSETHGVIIRKTGDRSSCSGVFDLPGTSASGAISTTKEQADSKTGPTSVGGGNSRERRNSCPVQFLDKAGAVFDAKSLTASGLTFVYGDEEVLAIQDALERSAPVVSLPTSTDPVVAENDSTVPEKTFAAPVKVDEQRTTNRMSIAAVAESNKIPVRTLREMVDFASKAWSDFTRDPTSAVYYRSADNQ